MVRVAVVAVLSCVAATFVATPHASIAGAALGPDPTPEVDGVVRALAEVGGRVVLAGSFEEVGELDRANVAALLPTGQVDPRFRPEVDGAVRAVAVSPDGETLFLGGEFTSVGGVPREHLAAVDATTGRLLPWRATVHAEVEALAVQGGRLLTGGPEGLDAFSLRRGGTLQRHHVDTDGPVAELVAHRDRIYVGGGFTTVEGLPRAGVAELLPDGTVTPWVPRSAEGPVTALVLSPDGTRLSVASGGKVATYLPARSTLPLWTARTDGDVHSLVASAQRVVLGGSFEQVTGSVRAPSGLAALDASTGEPTGWGLELSGGEGAVALLLTTRGVVAGGDFTTAAGRPRTGLLRVRTSRTDTGVSAGPDLRVRDDATVTLAGTVRTPSTGGPVEVEWQQTAGAPVELRQVAPGVAEFRPGAGRDTLAFTLVASDAAGRQWQDGTTVDVVATPTLAVLGDSLTARVDARRDPPTRESLTRSLLVDAGWKPGSVFWWARGGKTLTAPDRSGQTTFDNLRAATAALGGPVDLVYVGLGTNDVGAGPLLFSERVARVLDALDAAGVEEVVWMGLGFRDADDPRAATLDPLLGEEVAARGWTVVDFGGHMHAAGVFDPQHWVHSTDPDDRVHLTAAGYAERDALMVESLVRVRDR